MATWQGQSGINYEYAVLNIPHDVPPGGGNYIFVRSENNMWYPLYIGETQNFAARFQNHEKTACAQQRSMNQIHYHIHNGNAQVRRAEEQDLIRRWNPPCND